MAYRNAPSTTPRVTHSRRLAVCFVGVTGLLLAACNTPPADAPDDAVRERLVGSWLRDYDQDGAQVRRLLVLNVRKRDVHYQRVGSGTVL
jgi:hypothetical protein